MPHITGVIASAEAHGDAATLTVYAMVDEPVRHLAVNEPILMTVHRQPWQEGPDAVLDFVNHVIGRAGDIVYIEEAGGLRFDSFHTN